MAWLCIAEVNTSGQPSSLLAMARRACKYKQHTNRKIAAVHRLKRHALLFQHHSMGFAIMLSGLVPIAGGSRCSPLTNLCVCSQLLTSASPATASGVVLPFKPGANTLCRLCCSRVAGAGLRRAARGRHSGSCWEDRPTWNSRQAGTCSCEHWTMHAHVEQASLDVPATAGCG